MQKEKGERVLSPMKGIQIQDFKTPRQGNKGSLWARFSPDTANLNIYLDNRIRRPCFVNNVLHEHYIKY